MVLLLRESVTGLGKIPAWASKQAHLWVTDLMPGTQEEEAYR